MRAAARGTSSDEWLGRAPCSFEEFSAQHSQRVEEYLGDLVSSAGVDAEANTNVIAKISLLDQDLGEANRQKRKASATSSLVLVALMLVGCAALLSGFFWLLLVPAALLLAGGWKQLKPRWSNNKSESERIELERSAEISVAKAQMAPVNSAQTRGCTLPCPAGASRVTSRPFRLESPIQRPLEQLRPQLWIPIPVHTRCAERTVLRTPIRHPSVSRVQHGHSQVRRLAQDFVDRAYKRQGWQEKDSSSE